MPKVSDRSFLIVDDVPSVCLFLEQTLQHLNAVDIIKVGSGSAALDSFKIHFPDVVFLDIELPDMDGQSILKELKVLKPNVDVVMVSAHSSIDNVKAAISSGASGFIVKPFSPKKVASVLKTIGLEV